MESSDLKVGDKLEQRGRTSVSIQHIERRATRATVYNLTVDQDRNFHVGQSELLVHNCRPPNLSPPGADHDGAFNAAKRHAGIPTSQSPSRVLLNRNRRGQLQPGRVYEFQIRTPGGGLKRVRIREDSGGHTYRDDPTQTGDLTSTPKMAAILTIRGRLMGKVDLKVGFEAPSVWPMFGRGFQNAAWEILSVEVRRKHVGDDLELLGAIVSYLRPRLADVCSMMNVYLVGSAGLNPRAGTAAAHAARRVGVRGHLERSGAVVPRGAQVDRESVRPDGSMRLLTSIKTDLNDLAVALHVTQGRSMVCVASKQSIEDDELFAHLSAAIESDAGVDRINWPNMVAQFVGPGVSLIRASAEFDDPEMTADWFIDKSDSRPLHDQAGHVS